MLSSTEQKTIIKLNAVCFFSSNGVSFVFPGSRYSMKKNLSTEFKSIKHWHNYLMYFVNNELFDVVIY